ncbi:MFS transporter, partial [Streptomyces scabiei]|uniref:MFS transporter n=1 Tax=Streptomyces scabiei TaxID=1930 RepID=UPI0038F66814
MMFGAGYWYFLVTVVPFSIAVASIMPLAETIAVSGVRVAGHNYGRMRLWGSIAFLAATLVAGRVSDIYGPSGIIYVLLLATMATLAC